MGILLSNAIEYGDEGGTIRITLTQQHKKAVLSVLNTGIGIAPGELDRIFDRFYRVDKGRGRKTGNYGLDLSIAMEIALHHHAELHAESEYGKWADFRCTFPVQSRKTGKCICICLRLSKKDCAAAQSFFLSYLDCLPPDATEVCRECLHPAGEAFRHPCCAGQTQKSGLGT